MTKEKSNLNSTVEKEVVEGQSSSRKRAKSFVLDLRVHTPASVGYFGINGIDTAPALVSLARVKGLDMMAVTDYNSGASIDAIMGAASGGEIRIIPGANLRCTIGSCNDVALTCLFPENFRTRDVEDFLKVVGVPAQARGQRDFILNTPVTQIVELVESLKGFVMPSRMDQTPHRMSVLPVLVEEMGFRTFDLAYPDSAQVFKKKWPKIKFNLFSFSNANSLAQLGTRTAKVKMPELSFEGIRALTQREMVG